MSIFGAEVDSYFQNAQRKAKTGGCVMDKSFKLTLTDEDGKVVKSWSIADLYEDDFEDENWEPTHDFYCIGLEDPLDSNRLVDEITQAVRGKI